MEALKKYIVYPGFIKSRNDGDFHYISSDELMRLYGVSPVECIIIDRRRPSTIAGRRELPPDAIALHPRESGDYLLPTD